VVQAFCDLLVDEVNCRAADDTNALALRRYYRRLFLDDGTLSLLGSHGYASRLAPVLRYLGQIEAGAKLLDAGCGYGTEALLFALTGADVTGVELVPERVKLARARVGFYQSRAPVPLSIRFINADVVGYLKEGRPFDVIWAMEAISHIHPLETFLPLVRRCLSPGGLFIVSDPNGLNPIARYRAYRIRGTSRRTLRVKASDPDSGAHVYEAVERIFSVRGLFRLLEGEGFQVRQIAMSGFMASSLVPRLLHRNKGVLVTLTSLQRMLQALPFVRLLGTVYTVVAQKAASEGSAYRRSRQWSRGS
jgi:SAM-dependent methyltransferase